MLRKTILLILTVLLVSQSNAQNNAAHFTSFSQYYKCGNISISGQQLTVEALVKLDGSGPYITGQSANDIVSKHNGADDANYILRPDHCEITTTDGHFYTSIVFSNFSKDSFYHVAMTYDGVFLKFYVNGCLYSQVPASGNLITNNYSTTIGQLASNPTALSIEQLYGFADEIRIWSIARTEKEIKTNMRDLPGPTSQAGLLAYYKFEANSDNVQGNSDYNALPFATPAIEIQDGFDKIKPFSASFSIWEPSCNINDGNIKIQVIGGKAPYQYSLDGITYQSSNEFINLSSGSYNVYVKGETSGCGKDTTIILTSKCGTTDICSNTLNLPSQPSYVRIGDLDIPGNKITVEATINRTAPWSGSDLYQGDIVSKHEDPTDCNYLLRPSSAEITTTNGYFKTPVICPIQLNETYHVAMVYDGSTLKFFRNGYLMSQVAATGNLVLNNWQTQIGLYFNQVTKENFIGYINEVRIWNVSRTQSQIQNYMNISLTSPQSISGLLAYYTFDNLINKQGNTAWNGTLGGSASINKTNPNCNTLTLPQPTQMITICEGDKRKIGKYTGGIGGVWNTGATTDSIIVTAAGTYWIESNNLGCTIKDSFIVSIKPSPKISLGNKMAICKGDSLVLDAENSGAFYQWQNGNNSQTLVAKDSGVYYVKVSLDGCYASDTLHLTCNPVPIFNVFSSPSICEDQSTQPSIQASDNYSYIWSPSTGISNNIISNPIVSPSATTVYIVTATTSLGCIGKDTTVITVYPKPTVIISGNATICSKSSMQLQASGGIDYQWFPFQTLSSATVSNPIATPLTNTTYHVTVTDLNKCKNTDSVTVSIQPAILFNKPLDKEICQGDTVQLKGDEGYIYFWSPGTSLSEQNIFSPYAFPDTTTTYKLTISDRVCNNDTTFSVIVKVRAKPEIRAAKSNDIDCSVPGAQLRASGALTYTWFPISGLDDPLRFNPIAVVDTTTIYTVTGKDQYGCTNSDTIKVDVAQTGKFLALLPNAFTPNNDGKNDCFGVKKWGVIADLELSIFNRWGELIFFTKDPTHCWDGTYKGKLQPNDVFVYIVKASTNCGKIFTKGTVALIK